MTDQDVRQRLVSFLEQRAFRPVLEADPGKYPEARQGELRHIQEAIGRERGRFHACGSAEEVYRSFEQEVASDESRRIHGRLRELDLPTLADLRIDFEQLAQDLGVGPGVRQ